MKKLFGLLVVLLCFAVASLDAKDVHVKGYTRKDGTYVAPHVRTSPNKTKSDNYSTKGNMNPYTGKVGTKPRDDEAKSTTTSAPSTSRKGAEISKTHTGDSKIVGWVAVQSGMAEAELRRQLGSPQEVEGRADFEIWTYPTGIVFVKEGKVVAWKQERNR